MSQGGAFLFLGSFLMNQGKLSYPLKKPTTYKQQIERLISRGVIIHDSDNAISVLKRISYYRLTAYGLSIKKDSDQYIPNTTFEHIYRLYEFDSKLRVLLLSISEYVEISFRTHLIYDLAHNYGELGYRERTNFNSINHSSFLEKLDKLLADAKELFISHHKNKYSGQFPIWAAFEVITFGMLSTLFKSLKTTDKKRIAKNYYNVSYYNKIPTWLHSISVLRNRCAHYNRIYNKTLTIAPSLPDESNHLKIDNNQLFAIIYILKKLITDRSEWNSWVTQLEALIEAYPEVELKLIGFKENWVEILRNNEL